MKNTKAELISILHKQRFEPSFTVCKNNTIINKPVFNSLAEEVISAYYEHNTEQKFWQFHAIEIYKRCVQVRKEYKAKLRAVDPSLQTPQLTPLITTVTINYWIKLAQLCLSLENYITAMSYLYDRAHRDDEQTLGLSMRETLALNADIRKVIKRLRE